MSAGFSSLAESKRRGERNLESGVCRNAMISIFRFSLKFDDARGFGGFCLAFPLLLNSSAVANEDAKMKNTCFFISPKFDGARVLFGCWQASPMLLNSSAVAKMHMGEYQDAESSLIEVGKRSRVSLDV